ncbi:hypothetical protein A2477_04470 [Candidatus Falkowbacteria bacterium RIFOXYC2_FULL_47_12]|uniref:Toxin YoeB n=2 Tax=Candidatus Falkowiibacteriota TaxID=1752728 RepID=A0A1F5TLB5_9BACT|nr:MAG: hypothetical protein A2242_02210 [Candidatus Falkowbacteria bacterium RIFOXYA2_FULL_47_9]OGF39742.1 MAG: hypothetical protein A2477_04470 [Candidatus Falkowbacteria bacterium RIFOXYC2_FULL_47_12]
MASVVFGKDFLKSAKKLPGAQQRKLADLLLTLSQNCYYPTLHTKPLSDVLTGFYSFRITRDWRVVFRFNSVDEIQPLLAGHRKDIYKIIKRKI